MSVKMIDVEIPEELIPYLHTMKDGQSVTEKVTLSVVISLFVSKTITLEKAAELAGKSIWEFMDMLKTQNIPWSEYSEEEFLMDDLTLGKLAGGYYE